MQQLTYGRCCFALTISDRCLTLTCQGESYSPKERLKEKVVEIKYWSRHVFMFRRFVLAPLQWWFPSEVLTTICFVYFIRSDKIMTWWLHKAGWGLLFVMEGPEWGDKRSRPKGKWSLSHKTSKCSAQALRKDLKCIKNVNESLEK